MFFIQTNINGKSSQKQPFTDLIQNRKAYIFIKKETPTYAFYCDYCEILNIIWILIELFCRIWVQNRHFSYFLYCCFHTKIFRKCDFRTHYNIGSSTFLIQQLQNYRYFSKWSIVKTVNMSSLNIMLSYHFFRSGLASRGFTLLKNKSMQKFRRHWSMHKRQNSQKGKCKFIITICKDWFNLSITTTCIRVLEAVTRRCFVKSVFLKILQNSQKTSVSESFFNKVAGLRQLS